MAQQTLNAPDTDSMGVPTRDTDPRVAGDGYRTLIEKIGAMFTELYAAIATIDTATASTTRFVDVTVSSAELLALNATPKTLVAAPGANLALIFEGAVCFLDYNSAAYNGIAAGEDLAVKYTDSSGLQVASCETDPFLTATADATRYIQPYRAASGASQITPVANAPLVLHMLTGEIATGDSPLNMRVYYRVVPTAM